MPVESFHTRQSSFTSSEDDEINQDYQRMKRLKRIEKPHKTLDHSFQQLEKKKKRSLIEEIVNNGLTACEGEHYRRRSSVTSSSSFDSPTNTHLTTTCPNIPTHICQKSNQREFIQTHSDFSSHLRPSTTTFIDYSSQSNDIPVSNSTLSNIQPVQQQQPVAEKSDMCHVILTNWKSRSETRQLIKKCLTHDGQPKQPKKKQRRSSPTQAWNSQPTQQSMNVSSTHFLHQQPQVGSCWLESSHQLQPYNPQLEIRHASVSSPIEPSNFSLSSPSVNNGQALSGPLMLPSFKELVATLNM